MLIVLKVLVIIKSTSIYGDSAKSTGNDIINSSTIHADSAKSTCNDIIKYTNIKINNFSYYSFH